ncbi:MAG: protein phosphatase CheZ [Pseudomonadota bacterium]
MKLDDVSADMTLPPTSPEIFQQLGHLTRQLHDTLNQLGVLPKLRESADNLPDARSRLSYIATKTGQAAERVLNLVDQAKAEHEHIASETRRMAQSIVADPVRAVASGSVLNFVADVEATTARIDQHLTDIMMAQDFHDLTGQVVARVVTLASDLENQLVKLLVQAAPPEQQQKVEATLTASHAPAPTDAALHGPVVNPEGRTDVVQNQSEVDDLLASLGF